MSIVEIPNWAKSPAGASISCFKSTVAPVRPIIIIGGVHGDEPEGVALAEGLLKWLKSNSTNNDFIISPWIVIPRLNPDGLQNKSRTNSRGVDLNRNYPSRDWSPEAKAPRYYPGPKPGSEPEIQALVKLIQETSPQLIIHCHSWEPCIVYTGEPGRPSAQFLGDCSGYELREDIGYPTTGSLSRYGWHDHQIPVICIEEAEHTPLPEVWPRFSTGFQNIMLERSK